MNRFYEWLADRLPNRLIYFATIKLGVYATVGKYENTVVPDLTFLDAIKRWEDHEK